MGGSGMNIFEVLFNYAIICLIIVGFSYFPIPMLIVLCIFLYYNLVQPGHSIAGNNNGNNDKTNPKKWQSVEDNMKELEGWLTQKSHSKVDCNINDPNWLVVTMLMETLESQRRTAYLTTKLNLATVVFGGLAILIAMPNIIDFLYSATSLQDTIIDRQVLTAVYIGSVFYYMFTAYRRLKDMDEKILPNL